MGLTQGDLDGIKAVVDNWLPQTAELLALSTSANDLGERTAPGTYTVSGSVACRLGRPSTRNPFTAGRPVGEKEFLLSMPFGTNVAAVDAFKVDGDVYFKLGPAETAGAGYRTSTIVRVRLSDLNEAPVVDGD